MKLTDEVVDVVDYSLGELRSRIIDSGLQDGELAKRAFIADVVFKARIIQCTVVSFSAGVGN